MTNYHQLNEQRNQKIDAIKALGTNPDQSAFNALESEIRSLGSQIDNARKIAEFERQASTVQDGKFESEVRGSYNLLKAVREAVDGPQALTGFEKEVNSELSRDGKGEARGIRVPMSLLFPETRALTVANAASAGNTVFTQYGNLVDRLRPQPIVQALGATVISGLEGAGNLEIPRNLTGPTVNWLSETDSTVESSATYDKITLSARTAAAEMRLSRKLVLQNSVSLQQVLANDLAQVIALAIDKAAIAGTGASNQPTGIMTAIAANATTETEPSKVAADLLASIALGNDAATGILVSTAFMNAIRKGAYDTTGQPIAIPALLHGYTPSQTNQIATNTMIAGNWASLLIGIWNSFSLLVDPYSLSSAQQLKLVAAADVDVGIRHPESFSWHTVA